MNEVKVLEVINEQEVLGKQFRVYGTVENPLFLAKDVAEWIEHSNPSKMLNTVDEEEKTTLTISYSGNMTTNQLFLTEDGVYEVLMQSRKPIAKQFKKKVKEILKDIRKHGMYMTDNVLDCVLSNPDYTIKLLTQYKEEKEARQLAENKAKQLEVAIEESKPYVAKAKAIENAKEAIMVGNYARLLKNANINFGRTELFAWLRNKGNYTVNKNL